MRSAATPLLLALALVASLAHLSAAAVDVRNKYVVVLKPEASQSQFRAALQETLDRENARELPDDVEHKIAHEYAIGDGSDGGEAFKGFSGTFSRRVAARLRQDPSVAELVPDGVVRAVRPIAAAAAAANAAAAGTGRQDGAAWGLVRVSERDLNLQAPYVYPSSAGSGVTVAVIDTGIMISHPEFEGRAAWGATFCDGCPDEDDNGHGTHCAGTIGSKTYGVAKSASLVAVKVLGGDGSGTDSGVIAGINYVANLAKQGKGVVASMSLGGSYSSPLNKAVQAAIRAGVHFAVAAGNEAQDACNTSPASVREAVTVGASDNRDSLASFSNYGKCVDILAPGVGITSTWNDGGTNTISGTSMATPHTSGVIALLLADNPGLSPAAMATKLTALATKDKISIDKPSTVNLLLNNGVESSGGNPDPNPNPNPNPDPSDPNDPDWPWESKRPSN